MQVAHLKLNTVSAILLASHFSVLGQLIPPRCNHGLTILSVLSISCCLFQTSPTTVESGPSRRSPANLLAFCPPRPTQCTAPTLFLPEA